MKHRHGVTAMVFGAVVLGGCGGGVDASSPSNLEQGIVRPTANGGRNEVVMIHAVTVEPSTGGLVTRFCTGSYFAPRVVVTAAHCLENVFLNQVFVYYGDNYTQDVAQLTASGSLLTPPAPGQPSLWSQADSFETHPQWDPTLKHPDLGVVYLDRKLPFDPLPLARFRLDDSWLNRQVTISGWGANVATSPTTATGGRVQRTGRTTLLGSPTQADFHPEDPNPGMLNAAVRQNVIKTDGRAPKSNACFGDSGGPILVNRFGQDYIAGVGYFVGLSCEDYSLFTRIDPFLPFLDRAYRKGGQAPLTPRLDCVGANADGTLTAYFGYDNENGITFDVPYGAKNSLPLDTLGFRPTRFLPGEHHFVFGADFTPGQTLTYTLSPENSPTTTIRVNQSSPRCTAAQATGVECGAFCRGVLRSGCTNLQRFAECVDGCSGFVELLEDIAPQCLEANSALNQCFASTPSGADNWLCIPEQGIALSPACDPQLAAVDTCLNGG